MNVYTLIFELFHNTLFGGSVLEGLPLVSVTTISMFFTLLLIALPFVVVFFVFRWIFAIWK